MNEIRVIPPHGGNWKNVDGELLPDLPPPESEGPAPEQEPPLTPVPNTEYPE